MWIEILGHKINTDQVCDIYKDKVEHESIDKPYQICFELGGIATNCQTETQYNVLVIGFKEEAHRDKVFTLLDDKLGIQKL